MKTKEVLHSFSPSVFTWHGAKKGTDRSYPRTDALSHLKGMVLCRSFYAYLYLYSSTIILSLSLVKTQKSR
ncbi:hypothetical protein COM49_01280 [Bacillus pseudomycoides]|nr:hypothetical protein COO06_14805 [Bacillus pseudomycoides]PGD99081.1 hypothetical protein COM50_09265 [Bacillus pseudomycoides]PGE06170.1 hypothetical protein COM49_01280 [Bacillus pseudomycoides]PHE68617.1 hypothetical protein COF69_10565 [Bacillus pseudomycoides]PHG23249.1 hypothetical protein COI47_11245 [Bacillus pseudomycoides]